MDSMFILNPNISLLDVKDAISERITKARSIVFALSADSQTRKFSLSDEIINDALWAIGGFLDEMEILQNKLDEMTKSI